MLDTRWLFLALDGCDEPVTQRDDDTLSGSPHAAPHRPACDGAHGFANIRVDVTADVRELHVIGELDLWSRAFVTRSCLAGTEPTVVLNMAALTFLDCGGYGAIAAARLELERRGRKLIVLGAVGEPARLLDLIDRIDTT